jgi:hypothetical protein
MRILDGGRGKGRRRKRTVLTSARAPLEPRPGSARNSFAPCQAPCPLASRLSRPLASASAHSLPAHPTISVEKLCPRLFCAVQLVAVPGVPRFARWRLAASRRCCCPAPHSPQGRHCQRCALCFTCRAISPLCTHPTVCAALSPPACHFPCCTLRFTSATLPVELPPCPCGRVCSIHYARLTHLPMVLVVLLREFTRYCSTDSRGHLTTPALESN